MDFDRTMTVPLFRHFQENQDTVDTKAKELGIDSKLKCCEEFLRQAMKFNPSTAEKVTVKKLPKTEHCVTK